VDFAEEFFHIMLYLFFARVLKRFLAVRNLTSLPLSVVCVLPSHYLRLRILGFTDQGGQLRQLLILTLLNLLAHRYILQIREGKIMGVNLLWGFHLGGVEQLGLAAGDVGLWSLKARLAEAGGGVGEYAVLLNVLVVDRTARLQVLQVELFKEQVGELDGFV
jgi:hypothetical protein